MKYIITERQFNVISEQKTPITVRCKNFNTLYQKYCSVKMDKTFADKIISTNLPNAKSHTTVVINNLLNNLIDTYAKDDVSKKLIEKYNTAIKNITPKINAILYKNYTNSVYSTLLMSPKMSLYPILIEIGNILNNEFMNLFKSNYVDRLLAQTIVTSSNVQEIKEIAQKVFLGVVRSLYGMVSEYYEDVSYKYIEKNESVMSKSLPKCTEIILTEHPSKCTKLKTNFVPKKFIQYESPFITGDYGDSTDRTYKYFLPKLNKFIEDLV